MIQGLTKEDLDQALSHIGKDVSPEIKALVTKTVRAFAEDGKTPAEGLDISDEGLETLYSYAYQLFKSGKYKQAQDAFRFLCFLNPNYRNFFGLAASCQYLGNELQAVGNYLVCVQLDPLNPTPHFHLFGCYKKLDQLAGALQELEMTIALASRNPEYSLLKERAELEREGLKEVIKVKG